MRLFGESIRPDYLLMHREGQQESALLVCEVKRTDHNNLKDHFEQHFRQLRHIAISQNLPEIFGTLTNYRQWYFTRFSLQSEICNSSNHSSVHFEISDPFDLMSAKDDLSAETLAAIVLVIQRLVEHLVFF